MESADATTENTYNTRIIDMDINSGMVTFEYVYAHLGLIGWPVLITLAWKASSWFKTISDQAVKTVGQVDELATNHFPHMAESLKMQDGLLHSMDQSLKTLADVAVQNQPQFATAQAAGRKRKKQ